MMKPYEFEVEQDKWRDRIVYNFLKAGGKIYRNDYFVFGASSMDELEKYLRSCSFAKRNMDDNLDVFYTFRE